MFNILYVMLENTVRNCIPNKENEGLCGHATFFLCGYAAENNMKLEKLHKASSA